MGRRIAVALLLLASAQLHADIKLPAPAPPQADAQSIRVWRGGQTIIPLRGHDAGNGSVTFWIARSPGHGKLSNLRSLGDNRATITYANDGARPAAPDGFSYVVKSSRGQVSSPAEVRILVEEPPARLRVPARIDFAEIMAGETETRQLPITNEGGGVLEGRLAISNPWVLAQPDYRVESGETEIIDVAFRPNEAKIFVGQITLIGTDGGRTSVRLEGTARASVTLQSPNITNKPAAAASPSPTAVLRVDDGAREVASAAAASSSASPAIAAPQVAPSAETSAQKISVVPAIPRTTEPLIQVKARRTNSSQWELQWTPPKTPPASYRIEERLLSLDASDELQTTWRDVAAKISSSGNQVTAQIAGLNPRALHMLRVTALNPDGSAMWEGPLVALSPPQELPRASRLPLLIFGTALAALLLLRWRANRALA